jgi:hypothetical protein
MLASIAAVEEEQVAATELDGLKRPEGKRAKDVGASTCKSREVIESKGAEPRGRKKEGKKKHVRTERPRH